MTSEFTLSAQSQFEDELRSLLSTPHSDDEASQRFHSAVSHALLQGGKRFRPLLGLFTADLLNASRQEVIPFLAALEMIHCYSLVHDDLPCMDDDDFRRGQPSLHKIYDEATALLVGDALLTEAFSVISHHFQNQPGLGLKLVALLSKAAGRNGMVGGQVLDLFATDNAKSNHLELIHQLKTGGLIEVAIEGSAFISSASHDERDRLLLFGRSLGVAFQLADDLLDADTNEPTSFVRSFGKAKTEQRLQQLSEECRQLLTTFSGPQRGLLELIDFNLDRVSQLQGKIAQ